MPSSGLGTVHPASARHSVFQLQSFLNVHCYVCMCVCVCVCVCACACVCVCVCVYAVVDPPPPIGRQLGHSCAWTAHLPTHAHSHVRVYVCTNTHARAHTRTHPRTQHVQRPWQQRGLEHPHAVVASGTQPPMSVCSDGAPSRPLQHRQQPKVRPSCMHLTCVWTV